MPTFQEILKEVEGESEEHLHSSSTTSTALQHVASTPTAQTTTAELSTSNMAEEIGTGPFLPMMPEDDETDPLASAPAAHDADSDSITAAHTTPTPSTAEPHSLSAASSSSAVTSSIAAVDSPTGVIAASSLDRSDTTSEQSFSSGQTLSDENDSFVEESEDDDLTEEASNSNGQQTSARRTGISLAKRYVDCNAVSQRIRDRTIDVIGEDWGEDEDVQDVTEFLGDIRPRESPRTGGVGVHKKATTDHRATTPCKMARDCATGFLTNWMKLTNLTRGNRARGLALLEQKVYDRQRSDSPYKNVLEVSVGDMVAAVKELESQGNHNPNNELWLLTNQIAQIHARNMRLDTSLFSAGVMDERRIVHGYNDERIKAKDIMRDQRLRGGTASKKLKASLEEFELRLRKSRAGFKHKIRRLAQEMARLHGNMRGPFEADGGRALAFRLRTITVLRTARYVLRYKLMLRKHKAR